jgi:hypothetical protein
LSVDWGKRWVEAFAALLPSMMLLLCVFRSKADRRQNSRMVPAVSFELTVTLIPGHLAGSDRSWGSSLRVCTFRLHPQSTFQDLCSLFLLLISRREVRAVAVGEPLLEVNGQKGMDVRMLDSARSLSLNRTARRLPLLTRPLLRYKVRPSVSMQRQSRSVILLTNGVDVVRHTQRYLDLAVAVSVCSRRP